MVFEVSRVAVIGFIVVAMMAATTNTTTPTTVRLDDQNPFHTVSSSLLVGNKGEEILDVGVSTQACGDLWLFDHAELSVVKARFGAAQFVSLPERGCMQCQPLSVRWFHEPTGNLEFQVHVYRRHFFKACPSGSGL